MIHIHIIRQQRPASFPLDEMNRISKSTYRGWKMRIEFEIEIKLDTFYTQPEEEEEEAEEDGYLWTEFLMCSLI
jgi:hypothetical protein